MKKLNKTKKQQGFTLIELMIVVAIIGILSAVAVPAYQNYVKKSEAAAGMGTVRSLLTNIDLYIQENGSFPGSGNFSSLGASSGMNTLGSIALTPDTAASEAGSVAFNFDATASLNGSSITYTRSASGWSCANTTGQTLKSCN
ncbi:TPA: pilin [Vibrio vulnificus]|nr:pilin [Vibrio vulnificus]MCU8129745.1 prepilin-type N-terminal cleavage/methylation domain-containing protein [Vibrio vulnificus]MDT9655407.1 prepilin-type N-terminal cleavage/methylation domain-containing protein [Vibrio vulnificus]WIL73762.1 prepilin-type N-terminal cleavage/methylation domain-containing protein [Vibrio vulnificus]